MLLLLLKGWIAGLAIAMPVGPVDLICIHNSIRRGMAFGLMAGLGVAIADAIYGLIAGYSVVAIVALLDRYQEFLRLSGSLIVMLLGTLIFFSKPKAGRKEARQTKPYLVMLTTFFITFSNPLTFISLTAIYATLNIEETEVLMPLLTTLGVFLGSMLWWTFLSFTSSVFKNRIGPSFLKILNEISGTIIFFFGLFLLFY